MSWAQQLDFSPAMLCTVAAAVAAAADGAIASTNQGLSGEGLPRQAHHTSWLMTMPRNHSPLPPPGSPAELHRHHWPRGSLTAHTLARHSPMIRSSAGRVVNKVDLEFPEGHTKKTYDSLSRRLQVMNPCSNASTAGLGRQYALGHNASQARRSPELLPVYRPGANVGAARSYVFSGSMSSSSSARSCSSRTGSKAASESGPELPQPDARPSDAKKIQVWDFSPVPRSKTASVDMLSRMLHGSFRRSCMPIRPRTCQPVAQWAKLTSSQYGLPGLPQLCIQWHAGLT